MDAADDSYDAAARDAGLRARLQAAFGAAGGHGDVLDELWWRERAGRPHPAGLPDPALERVALVEAAYSNAKSEQDARQAAATLRTFEAHRGRQGAALDVALAATRVHPRQHPDAVQRDPFSDSRAAVSPDDPTRTRPGSSPAADGPARPLAFARRHRTLLSVAALVVAAAVGALAASGAEHGAPTAPSPAPTAEAAAPSTVLTRALGRVQVPTDALPSALRTTIDPRSSRLLYDDDPEGGDTKARWRLWAGTGENPAQLCFVTTFDNVQNSVTCLPRASALDDRIIVTDATVNGTFEALVDGGSVAVQIN